MEFSKDNWLVSAKDEFKTICNNIVGDDSGYLDFTYVLGNVIEKSFKTYSPDNDLFLIIGYSENELNEIYEFDEENFDCYFDKNSFIKSYKDALDYYSLNNLFLDSFREELEEFIDNLC